MKLYSQYLKTLIKEEGGHAFIMILVLLILGSLIITPTLHFLGSALIGGEVYETKTDEIYAADAGVEDALWYIRNDRLEDLFGDYTVPSGYDTYKYYEYNPNPTNEWTYQLSQQINNIDVIVTIQNMWIPYGIPEPSEIEGRELINNTKLVITGSAQPGEPYKIRLTFNADKLAGEDANDLTIKSIGIWLPPGFSYVPNSCNLSSYSFYNEPTEIPYRSGTAVIWIFNQTFDMFEPGSGPTYTRQINFNYTSTIAGRPFRAPDASAA